MRIFILLVAVTISAGSARAEEVSRKDLALDAAKVGMFTAGTLAGSYWTARALRPGSVDSAVAADVARQERLAGEMDVEAAKSRAKRDLLLSGHGSKLKGDKLASKLIQHDLEIEDAKARAAAARKAAKNGKVMRSLVLPLGRGGLAFVPGLATAANMAGFVDGALEMRADIVHYRAQEKRRLQDNFEAVIPHVSELDALPAQ